MQLQKQLILTFRCWILAVLLGDWTVTTFSRNSFFLPIDGFNFFENQPSVYKTLSADSIPINSCTKQTATRAGTEVTKGWGGSKISATPSDLAAKNSWAPSVPDSKGCPSPEKRGQCRWGKRAEGSYCCNNLSSCWFSRKCLLGVCHGSSLAASPRHRYSVTLLLPWQLTGFCGTQGLRDQSEAYWGEAAVSRLCEGKSFAWRYIKM